MNAVYVDVRLYNVCMRGIIIYIEIEKNKKNISTKLRNWYPVASQNEELQSGQGNIERQSNINEKYDFKELIKKKDKWRTSPTKK